MKINVKKDGFRDKKVDFKVEDETVAFWSELLINREEDLRTSRNNTKYLEAIVEVVKLKLEEAKAHDTTNKEVKKQ